MTGVAIACSAHSANSVQHRRVNLEVVDQAFCKVKAENISEDKDAAGGTVAEGNDLADFAFHLGQGFFDHRRCDQCRRLDADTRQRKFVHLRWNICRRLIHRLSQVFADDVDDEDAAPFEIAQRVLFGVAGWLARGGEADDRWVAGDGVEEAVRSEIVGAVLADRRDPGDRSWDDHTDHELVEVFRAGVFGFDDHRSAVFRLTLDWKQ